MRSRPRPNSSTCTTRAPSCAGADPYTPTGPIKRSDRRSIWSSVGPVTGSRLSLIEFPADDPERARRFWEGLLDHRLEDRVEGEGSGRQTRGAGPAFGIHARGAGPGDTASLPYFGVRDMALALERVRGLGGSVIHPGEAWSVCRDSEGTPFGLTLAPD